MLFYLENNRVSLRNFSGICLFNWVSFIIIALNSSAFLPLLSLEESFLIDFLLFFVCIDSETSDLEIIELS